MNEEGRDVGGAYAGTPHATPSIARQKHSGLATYGLLSIRPRGEVGGGSILIDDADDDDDEKERKVRKSVRSDGMRLPVTARKE